MTAARRRLSPVANLALRMVADGIMLAAAFAGSFLIRFDGRVSLHSWEVCAALLPWVVVLKLGIYGYARLYRSLWRYSGVNDLRRLLVAQAMGLGTTVFLVTMSGEAARGFPRGIYVIDAVVSLVLTGGLRFLPRWMRESMPANALRTSGRHAPNGDSSHVTNARPVLIVGAGDAGEMIVRDVTRNPANGLRVVGFADDDPRKQGREIHGAPVLGACRDIARLAQAHGVKDIIIAIAAASGPEIRAILRHCRGVKARLRIVPSLDEILSGAAQPADIRDLRLEDLLRRKEVDLDLARISGYLKNKRILITGAGGSIGSELCLQIARFEPRELLLLGRGENSIFWIAQELAYRFPSIPHRQIIGDVINKRKLEGVFSTHRPEIVFHAGADKHVPLMEMNPDEAVLNNVLGTRNVLEVCEAFGVEKLVCISTDKVVNAASVMGCCKRLAEMVVQSRAWRTPSIVVRFGNVLGSRGSVVPLFHEQIRRGGPVTITHPEMTRFFMTIPEAAKLVIQAGALGCGGEIFVLDMGDQIRIADLAREMIQLSRHGAKSDVPIQIVGIRPGEKLTEEIAEATEELLPTNHPKVRRIAPNGPVPPGLHAQLGRLFDAALAVDHERIRSLLPEIVSTYHPSSRAKPLGKRPRARRCGAVTEPGADTGASAIRDITAIADDKTHVPKRPLPVVGADSTPVLVRSSRRVRARRLRVARLREGSAP